MAPLPPIVQAMLHADIYPHATRDIRLVQTHISWVVLTGDFAYKIKKPVNFGFLDFSTLEKRRFFCEEELRLNRRLAPGLYLDVLPIAEREGGFELGGMQGIAEWCIQMRQFPDEALLASHIQAGTFEAGWMDDIATDLAAFHRTAGSDETITAFGAPSFLLRHIDASLNTALHRPDAIDADMIHELRRTSMQQAEQRKALFGQRMREGRIRDCHGDLHLGNITLQEGHPTVFDCIEFNPEYRAIDTLNDAAFLVMDCDARGRADLAFRFLSRYLEFSGDYAGIALLSLFLSYRAGVRGKVACLLTDDPGIKPEEKHIRLTEAAHYFGLAHGYLHKPPSPALFAIGGYSGSGKSRLAMHACAAERAIVIRTDATRKRIAADHPELELYGEVMNDLTHAAMFEAARTLLTSGWPVVLDATFLSRDRRDEARKLAASCDVPFHFIWMDIAEGRLRENIRRRQQADTDISDADLSVLDRQMAIHPRPIEADITFHDSADHWPALPRQP